MSIGREILEETRKITEVAGVRATYYNSDGSNGGQTGQYMADFQASIANNEVIYHKIIDWCNSLDEIYEYSGKALKELVDFIETTDYYIETASVSVWGMSNLEAGMYPNWKNVGSWDIYRDGEFTDELPFAKDALGYE